MSTTRAYDQYQRIPEKPHLNRAYFDKYIDRPLADPNDYDYRQATAGFQAAASLRQQVNYGEPGYLAVQDIERGARNNQHSYHTTMASKKQQWERAEADHWENLDTNGKFQYLAVSLFGEANPHMFDRVAERLRTRVGAEEFERANNLTIKMNVIRALRTDDRKEADDSTFGLHGYTARYGEGWDSTTYSVIECYGLDNRAGRQVQLTQVGSLVLSHDQVPPISKTPLPDLPDRVTQNFVIGGYPPQATY